MRIVTFLIFIQFVSFLSCKKDEVSYDSVTGNWKLIEIYDKTTSAYINYPAGSTGDVVINFTGTGTYSGKTLRNTFRSGSYSIISATKISFDPFLETTQVIEDEWGGAFLTVLQFCGLSSTIPCPPMDYSIHNDILTIIPPLRYIIKLEKIQ